MFPYARGDSFLARSDELISAYLKLFCPADFRVCSRSVKSPDFFKTWHPADQESIEGVSAPALWILIPEDPDSFLEGE
jgi:hypothetical protein